MCRELEAAGLRARRRADRTKAAAAWRRASASARRKKGGPPRPFAVLLDGGVRRGGDVFKALAVGADACGIGRPALYGLAAYGQQGVERCLAMLRDELQTTLMNCGCVTLDDVEPDMVVGVDLLAHTRATLPSKDEDRVTVLTHRRAMRLAKRKAEKAAWRRTQGETGSAGGGGRDPRYAAAVLSPVKGARGGGGGGFGAGGGPGVSAASVSALAALLALLRAVVVAVVRTFLTLNVKDSLNRAGVFLVVFCTVHMLGNLTVFWGPEAFNAYGYALSSNPLLTAIEYYLAAACAVHAVMGTYLTFRYKKLTPKRGGLMASLRGGKLFLSGLVLLSFVAVHLLDFRFGAGYTVRYKAEQLPALPLHSAPAVPDYSGPGAAGAGGCRDGASGQTCAAGSKPAQGVVEVRDLHRIQLELFSARGGRVDAGDPALLKVALYVAGVCAVGFHMYYGWANACHKWRPMFDRLADGAAPAGLGADEAKAWRKERSRRLLQAVSGLGQLFAAVVTAGFVACPLYTYIGSLQ